MPPPFDYLAFCTLAIAALAGLHLWARQRRHAAGLSIVTWCALGVVLAIGSFAVSGAERSERKRLESIVSGFAPTYAAELSRMGHAQVMLTTPEDNPAYLRMIEAQKRWVSLNPAVADIYTFRRLPDGRIILLVDSETDYDGDGRHTTAREVRTRIGEEYPNQTDRLALAFAGIAGFDDAIATDRWGTWVSAYQPMYDDRGKVEAVLGVDYDAGQWLSAIRRSRLHAILYIAVLVAILGGSAAVISVLRTDLGVRRLAEETLLRAKEESDTAAHARSEFVANVSHEIRTPMTAILGYAEVLLAPGNTAEDQAECIRIIRRNGEHMLAILNDILDSSRIDAGRVQVERIKCSPVQIVEEVRSLMLVRAAPRGVELRTELSVPFPQNTTTDPIRLKQILLNLVGNAINFTEQGSITLRAAYETGPGGRGVLRFDIVDTGVGMDADQLERLFTPFYQAGSTPRRTGGTGLGLSISRRLAEMLGGDISVVSEPGRGSTFTLRIDAGPEETLALPPEFPEPAGGSPAPSLHLPSLRARILVAEDGIDNQRLIRLFLERAGATVEVAENGRIAADRAIAAFRTGRPFDLILMDLQMPELDGFGATRLLRSLGYPGPIIALTALTMTGDREACLAAGCDGSMTKPIDRASLITGCAAWIGHSRPRQAA